MPRQKPAVRTTPPAGARGRAGPFSYLGLFQASPLERIRLIKGGIPAVEAKRILADLAIGPDAGLPVAARGTARQVQVLAPGDSERVVGIAKLVGQVEAMVRESGNPEGFDAAAWMARWLRQPLPAFGGVRPVELIDTMEGQAMVSTVLAQMQSGAYA